MRFYKMQAKDLRNKNMSELTKTLDGQTKDFEKYMHDIYKGKEKNVSKSRFFKKDIARIKTVMAEKKFMKETKNA